MARMSSKVLNMTCPTCKKPLRESWFSKHQDELFCEKCLEYKPKVYEANKKKGKK